MNDRDRLAQLINDGQVFRKDGEYERRHPKVTKAFVRDIERRVLALRGPIRAGKPINLAIRPKKGRRK